MPSAAIQNLDKVTPNKLLDIAKKFNEAQLSEFVKKVNLLHSKRQKTVLPPTELSLLRTIEATLPNSKKTRLKELNAIGSKRQLSESEQKEMLEIIDEIDDLNLSRAKAVQELAKLKKISAKEVFEFFNLAQTPNV